MGLNHEHELEAQIVLNYYKWSGSSESDRSATSYLLTEKQEYVSAFLSYLSF